MKYKSKQKIPPTQVHRLPAGLLPGDFNTELVGDPATRKVYIICNGRQLPFATLKPEKKATLYAQMLSDDKAMADLQHLHPTDAMEEYAFCLYGQADHKPDFLPCGSPAPSENFMCSDNCRCLSWQTKNITLMGHKLTPRQVEVTRLLASDKPDKAIAAELGITESTLDIHKKKLFSKAGVQSKTGFVRRAIKQKVIQ